MIGRSRRAGVWTVIAAALILSGCRIGVTTDMAFDRSGGGELAVSMRIDGATLRALDAAGVDPALDVAVALGSDTAWDTERRIDADGGLVVTYRHAFADGTEATALLAELWADVPLQDPALVLDVTVTTTTAGAVRMEGTAVLRPPSTLGVRVDGVAVGPVDEELAALTAQSVRTEVQVRVPGRVAVQDADTVDGRSARWNIPVGEPRALTLEANAPAWWRRVPAAAYAVAAVSSVAAVGLMRRSRRATTPEPAGAVSPTV